MSVALLVIKVHIFRIISLSIARKQKKLIELQTSVKQDDTTRTRTPKPGYPNLSISMILHGVINLFVKSLSLVLVFICLYQSKVDRKF